MSHGKGCRWAWEGVSVGSHAHVLGSRGNRGQRVTRWEGREVRRRDSCTGRPGGVGQSLGCGVETRKEKLQREHEAMREVLGAR